MIRYIVPIVLMASAAQAQSTAGTQSPDPPGVQPHYSITLPDYRLARAYALCVARSLENLVRTMVTQPEADACSKIVVAWGASRNAASDEADTRFIEEVADGLSFEDWRWITLPDGPPTQTVTGTLRLQGKTYADMPYEPFGSECPTGIPIPNVGTNMGREKK